MPSSRQSKLNRKLLAVLMDWPLKVRFVRTVCRRHGMGHSACGFIDSDCCTIALSTYCSMLTILQFSSR